MLVLALDLGTSSTRSALFDQRGQRLAATTAQRAYTLRTDRHGKAELDPLELLKAVEACIDESLAALRGLPEAGQPIAGVGTSCFWHSMVGTDPAGAPLTPVITWADSRCRDDAARLRERLDERAVHQRTGCMLRASFWPAKLRWLARTRPALMKRVAYWMSPAEWLYLRLCGEGPESTTTAHGMATATGLYDPARRTWDAGMLRTCRLRAAQLLAIDDAPMAMAPAAAARFPELAQARWYPAIGDGAANNLGAGATSAGLAAINFGTSGAVRILRDGGRPRAPFGLFCYRVDARRHLLGGAISNAGGLRAWCLRELRLPDDEAAIEAALAARPGPAHGLRVLPFWMAERAPTWREDLTGAVIGITQSTSALDLLQAITEATYHRLATIIDLIPRSGGLRCIVGGGIQKSPSSLQRLADVTGQVLVASEEPETSLRGAAVIALEQLGQGRALRPLTGATVRPRVRFARRYAAERAALARLERALHP